MPVGGHPVVIAANGKGVPVRPVSDRAPLLTVATNGKGAPIVISDLGAPFIVQGYDAPQVQNLRVLSSDNGAPLTTDNGDYLETYPDA